MSVGPSCRVNGDGSGLQAYALFTNNAHPDVANLGISGDGRVAFYEVTTDPWELGVFNWDGSGQRVLATGLGGANTGGEVVQLTYDGSKLNYGSLNRLYNTDGSGVLQPAATGPTLSGDPPLMVGNYGFFLSSMNRDATRFLFTFDYNTWVNGVVVPEQLGILEINPASLGQAPSLTEPKIAPSYLVRGDSSTTSFSVRSSTANTHLRTNAVVFRNGLEVNSNIVNDAVLYDDGSHGDAAAGDGRFTNNAIRANSEAAIGPHTARMKTEVRAADGLRHATALDVAQLDVVTEAPPGMGTCTPTPTPTSTATPTPTRTPTPTSTYYPHADPHRDGHRDRHPRRLRRADRGWHDRAHAGLSPAHILHQLSGNTRRQTGLHPLGRREPRRLCHKGRSFSRLCHQCGWHGAARGGHGSRRLGADSGHQRRRIEGVVERQHQGAHRECGRHGCARGHGSDGLLLRAVVGGRDEGVFQPRPERCHQRCAAGSGAVRHQCRWHGAAADRESGGGVCAVWAAGAGDSVCVSAGRRWTCRRTASGSFST